MLQGQGLRHVGPGSAWTGARRVAGGERCFAESVCVSGRASLQVWRAQPVGRRHVLPACERTRMNQAFQGTNRGGLLTANFVR